MSEHSTRLALIVDCGFGHLQASAVSARRLRECLVAHGFTVHVLRGKAATRANLCSWIRVHAGRLGRGDALALAYIGHGVKVRDPAYCKGDVCEAQAPADVLLLVTHDVLPDVAACQPDEQAGVTGVDLMDWLRPVSAATDNVTILLDCCHSTGLVRAGPALDAATRTAFEAAHRRAVAQIRKKHAGALRGGLESHHPAGGSIVRLVATSQDGVAVEHDGVGLFSDAVARSLAAPDALALTWDDHIVVIRDHIVARSNRQHPAVEGPRDRLPFSTTTGRPTDSAVATRAGKDHRILAGLLHGVEVGDAFRVEHAADPTRALGAAPVRAVYADAATLDLAPGTSDVALRAVLIRRERPIPVVVEPDPSVLAHLHADQLARIGVVLCPRGSATPVDTLELRDGAAHLHAHEGRRIFTGAAGDDIQLLHALWRLAHYRRVTRGATLVAGAPVDPAVNPIEVKLAWGLAGLPAFSDPCISIPEDSAVWLRVDDLSHPTLYVDVFHLRGDCSIRHLTAEFDHGDTLNRSAIGECTRGAGNAADPWRFPWPSHVPRDTPLPERLMLVFSRRPRSLHGLASFETTRVLRGPPSAEVPPRIHFLDFDLLPTAAPHRPRSPTPHRPSRPPTPRTVMTPFNFSDYDLDALALQVEAQLAVLTSHTQPPGVESTFRGPSRARPSAPEQEAYLARVTEEPFETFWHKYLRHARRDLCLPGGQLHTHWQRWKDLQSKEAVKMSIIFLAGIGVASAALAPAGVAAAVCLINIFTKIGIDAICEGCAEEEAARALPPEKGATRG